MQWRTVRHRWGSWNRWTCFWSTGYCHWSQSPLFSGIYIPEDDRDAPEKFRGLGVRIEDDVVVTQDSPLILSADCPKEMNDIEQICSRTSWPPLWHPCYAGSQCLWGLDTASLGTAQPVSEGIFMLSGCKSGTVDCGIICYYNFSDINSETLMIQKV